MLDAYSVCGGPRNRDGIPTHVPTMVGTYIGHWPRRYC